MIDFLVSLLIEYWKEIAIGGVVLSLSVHNTIVSANNGSVSIGGKNNGSITIQKQKSGKGSINIQTNHYSD